MQATRRIALYGGTFDPVHLGHIAVARRISELFELDQLLFIPAQIAPHKLTRPVTAPIHRYAMLALATESDSKIRISTFELDGPDRRYTVDTVSQFQSSFGDAVEMFFIMGADSWAEINTWRDWPRLLTMTNHIVVTRPGYEISAEHVDNEVRNRMVDLRRDEWGTVEQSHDRTRKNIFITDVVMMEISATAIRRMASDKRFDELTQLLPNSVVEYIRKYELYQDLHET